MDGKTKAIVAHIFFVGWIISYVVNMNNKDDITNFYLRQTLLLHVVLIIGWIPVFGNILALIALVFLIISLISALNNEKKEIPFIGNYFQDWLKAL